MIHETAIVHPKAEIGENVEIGAFSIIRENVTIGSGTKIGPHVVIDPFVDIGADCNIFQYAAIGAEPQAVKFSGEETYVRIGRGNIIREFVTIHRGTAEGGGVTIVGEENLIMAYSHIAHDCKLGNHIVLANNATLAGHIVIGDHATIGGLVAIHQFVRVGHYSFIAGKAGILKDVPPYMTAAGYRANLYGLNLVGLKRRGFSRDKLSKLKKAYRLLFRIGLTRNEAIERVAAEVEQIPEVVSLIEFIKSSERGITR